MSGIDVLFQPLGRRVVAGPGETLLEAARRHGVRIVSACGGRGICRSCAVRIEGAVPLPNDGDEETFDAAELAAGWRRACRLVPLGSCTVHVPARTAAVAVARGQEGGAATVPIEDPVGGAADAPWGLAVDLGTTNIAAALIDMTTGAVLATAAKENPQGAFGADIVSRMAQVLGDPRRADELQHVVVAALAEIASHVTGGAAGRIGAVAVVGNTVMHHLLLHHSIEPLAHAPYRPVTLEPADVAAASIGLRLAPGARLWAGPNVAGFIGSDHVAALMDVFEAPPAGRFMLVDIGTNTEISLVAEGRTTAVSCASGPAFEGWTLTCGMRAAPGAVERVRIEGDDVRLETIEGERPIGLCGSGVVSLIAELRRAGALNARGALQAAHPRVRVRGGEREFTLLDHDGAAALPLVFAQDDVRAIQLAKAAIRAGVDLLLVENGLTEKDLDAIVIAGAFGRFLSVDDLVTIGMLPDVDRARVTQVGNSAGAGVRRLLVCRAARARATKLAREVRYLELAQRPDFQKTFLARTAL